MNQREREMLAEAMLEARKKFYSFLDDEGYDASYFDLSLEGTLLDNNYNTTHTLTMDDVDA